MKLVHAFLAAASLATATATASANPQPQVLLESHSDSGFSRPYVTKALVLRADGTVVSTTNVMGNGAPQTTVRTLATLDKTALAALIARIDAIADKPLVDRESGSPRCTDVPSRHDEIVQSSGQRVGLYQEASCHHYDQADSNASALKDVVDGLRALDSL